MPLWSGAQTVESFRLPKNYIGKLDEILNELGGDLNIRFIFDKATLQQYNTSLMTDNEKTVGWGCLKCLLHHGIWLHLLGKDGFIYVAKNKDQLDKLLQNKEEVKIEKQQSRKTLVPKKRNFLLSGEIVDSDNGERIPFATIRIDGTTKGVTSDQNGPFRFGESTD